jgi:transcriptional regulator with XRE-family HTH domain
MSIHGNAAPPYGRRMDQVAVGRRIAAARKRAGIATRAELAQRVSLPRLGKETLGKIERGERQLYEHEAPYVARALEVPVSYFFEDERGESQLDRIEANQQRILEILAAIVRPNAGAAPLAPDDLVALLPEELRPDAEARRLAG